MKSFIPTTVLAHGFLPALAGLVCLWHLTATPAVAAVSGKLLKQSVVKVYVTGQRSDYGQPWQVLELSSVSGSGFVIGKRRILTNAHVVSDARFIEVQREGDPRKFQARVLFAGHDCDLAILAVDNEAFFEGTRALPLGEKLPDLNDEVEVVGYPMGGERLSLTRGVVSRIDYAPYAHSGVDAHLVIQVDAAINPGNSGGPVLFNGKVAGLAFQGLEDSQNIGYAIPTPVIRHFLKDIEDGTYDGFPDFLVTFQNTRNPTLRRELGLPDDDRGIAVSQLHPFTCAWGRLQTGDVILDVDGYPVANDGTIVLDGRIMEFAELLERKQAGDTLDLVVWRNREKLRLQVPLTVPHTAFLFRHDYDHRPDYCVAGGLVFSPLSSSYMAALGIQRLTSLDTQHFRYTWKYALPDALYKERDQVVVLIRRLAHPCNTYADGFILGIVASVNGEPIRRLEDIPRALRQPRNGFHVFRFDGMDNTLAMDAQLAAEADRALLEKHVIPAISYFNPEQVTTQRVFGVQCSGGP
ncbi:MAG: trypsin-like peptidase domain-containing protein [Lentisphaerae bacterium]|nr:trypsin-like peptidase domain-containing protein [Lentisphaerota bacterium]